MKSHALRPWEVSEDGWVKRSVEWVGPERRVQAAAALDEVLGARDTGGIAAVQAYEMRYGIVPEKPPRGHQPSILRACMGRSPFRRGVGAQARGVLPVRRVDLARR